MINWKMIAKMMSVQPFNNWISLKTDYNKIINISIDRNILDIGHKVVLMHV